MSNQVKTIVVVGAGTMGSGIALTAAQAGIGAVLVDINQEQLDKARAYHTKTLARAVEKQKLTADAAAAAGQKLCYVTTIAETKNADWVVEAASENPEVKKKLFRTFAEVFCSKCRACVQYKFYFDHGYRNSNWRARESCDWNALFQSSSADEIGRSHSWSRNE